MQSQFVSTFVSFFLFSLGKPELMSMNLPNSNLIDEVDYRLSCTIRASAAKICLSNKGDG